MNNLLKKASLSLIAATTVGCTPQTPVAAPVAPAIVSAPSPQLDHEVAQELASLRKQMQDMKMELQRLQPVVDVVRSSRIVVSPFTPDTQSATILDTPVQSVQGLIQEILDNPENGSTLSTEVPEFLDDHGTFPEEFATFESSHIKPTVTPTDWGTPVPNVSATDLGTPSPSGSTDWGTPTPSPTPSVEVSASPSTSVEPTVEPTVVPSTDPTIEPSVSASPSVEASPEPSTEPTVEPSDMPTE